MPEDKNHNQDLQITDIKTDVCWLKKEVGLIKTNDLPHIYSKIDRIEYEVVIGIGAAILLIFLKLF